MPFIEISFFRNYCLGLSLQRVSRQVGTPLRSFAEKAVAKEMDWDALSEMIHSDEGKRELASLRSTFFDVHSKLSSTAKDIPPPNWAEWSKELDPKIVDAFKKAFESK